MPHSLVQRLCFPSPAATAIILLNLVFEFYSRWPLSHPSELCVVAVSIFLALFRLSCPSSSTARCQQLQASSAFINSTCGSCFRRATVGLNQVTSLSRGSLERVGGLASSCCQKLIGAEGVARLGFLPMNSKTSGRVSKSAEPQLPPVAAGARLHTHPAYTRNAWPCTYSHQMCL